MFDNVDNSMYVVTCQHWIMFSRNVQKKILENVDYSVQGFVLNNSSSSRFTEQKKKYSKNLRLLLYKTITK